jgi:hypothetical protein
MVVMERVWFLICLYGDKTMQNYVFYDVKISCVLIGKDRVLHLHAKKTYTCSSGIAALILILDTT